MYIISCNINGIRAGLRRGFFDWVIQQNADIICLQELKASLQDCIKLPGYSFNCHIADKKGYSGVGIYSKLPPCQVITGLGWHAADSEGRYIELRFKDLHIASIYLPSGTSGPHRQTLKEEFMAKYMSSHLEKLADKKMIICGDWNIAHNEIDLKNWRQNQKNTGFLPHERAWLDECFDKAGLVDAYRYIHPNKEEYTWWTYRGQARKNNVGWRIDYQMVTKNIMHTIKSAHIYNDEIFSDHAPLVVEYSM